MWPLLEAIPVLGNNMPVQLDIHAACEIESQFDMYLSFKPPGTLQV